MSNSSMSRQNRETMSKGFKPWLIKWSREFSNMINKVKPWNALTFRYKINLGSILLSSQSQSFQICFRTYKHSRGKRKIISKTNNKAEEVMLPHHGLKLRYIYIQCSFLSPWAHRQHSEATWTLILHILQLLSVITHTPLQLWRQKKNNE